VPEGRITDVQASHGGIDNMLDAALKNMTKLYFLYKHESVEQKIRIIVSTYPEKFLLMAPDVQTRK